MEPEKDYAYGERKAPEMPDRALEPGEGRITGYLSAALGIMSLLGVICFYYPSWLTTPELRELYSVSTLRLILRISLITSFTLGLVTFIRNKRKRMGAVGVICTLVAYLLGGADVPVGELHETPIAVGMDWLLLDLLRSAIMFIFIEKLFPKYKEQAILRPGWRTDLSYFTINHLLIGFLLLGANRVVPGLMNWAVNADLQGWVRSAPVPLQVVLLIFAADFFQYWVHRAYHEIPRLWKLHAVHHSTEYMDWLAGSRNHIVEIFFDRTLSFLPLYLLGPDKGALDAYVLFASIQAVFVHANVNIPFGPLRYLIVTPQYHHWHHSSDKPAIDTNYAVHLPLLDWVFGTLHMPKEHWPLAYGTVTPIPKTLWEQFVYPFTPDEKKSSTD